jgi:predicted Zn finger-like uncharacterized protein
MLIVCPNCSTAYALTEAQLGQGRTLRCAKCRHTWRATVADAADGAPSSPGPGGDPPPEGRAEYRDGGMPDRERGTRQRGAAKPRSPWGAAALVARIRRIPAPQLLLTATFALLLLALAERQAIVRAAPQTAQLFAAVRLPVNLRGLALQDVRSQLITDKDEQILVVEGQVRNLQAGDSRIPPLALALRDEKGNEIYAWTADPPRSVLAPGESAPFRARLVAPPLDGRDVLVRFARNENGAPQAQ